MKKKKIKKPNKLYVYCVDCGKRREVAPQYRNRVKRCKLCEYDNRARQNASYKKKIYEQRKIEKLLALERTGS